MNEIVVYNTPHLVHWDWRVAFDLFCGGTGVGAFLTAVLTSLYWKDKYPRVSKVGAVLAPLLVISGLSLLLTEMGHPFRLFYTLTRFNVTSAFSWAGPIQGLFILIALAYAYLWLMPGSSASTRKAVGLAGIPVALLLGAYHGWLLAVLPSRPLWNTAATVVAALTAAVLTGMAAVLLVGYLVAAFRNDAETVGADASERPAVGIMPRFLFVLVAALVAHSLALLLWWANLQSGSQAAGRALAAANAEVGGLFLSLGMALGIAVPAILLIVNLKSRAAESPRVGVPLGILAAVLILVGGFVFRYAVVLGGQVS